MNVEQRVAMFWHEPLLNFGQMMWHEDTLPIVLVASDVWRNIEAQFGPTERRGQA